MRVTTAMPMRVPRSDTRSRTPSCVARTTFARAPRPTIPPRSTRRARIASPAPARSWRSQRATPIRPIPRSRPRTRVQAGRRVHLPSLTGTDAHGAPWVAPAGRPFLLLGLDGDITPDRYAEIARRLAPAVAVYVIAPASADPAPFAPAQLVSLDDAS